MKKTFIMFSCMVFALGVATAPQLMNAKAGQQTFEDDTTGVTKAATGSSLETADLSLDESSSSTSTKTSTSTDGGVDDATKDYEKSLLGENTSTSTSTKTETSTSTDTKTSTSTDLSESLG